MNESQKSEIANYLLAKKLPIDIMLEVQDHFISQIQSLEIEENLNFEEAFEKVKATWRKELSLSWKGEISLMDSTDFMRKMNNQILKSTIIDSVKFTIPYIFLVFLVANTTNEKFFQVFFVLAFAVPFLYAAANYIRYFKDFRLAKKHESHLLTLHQNGVTIFFLLISPMINVFIQIFSKPIRFHEIFLFHVDGWRNISYVILFLSLIFVFGGIAYSIISQKNYLKQIQKVKIFLEKHQFSI